MFNSLFYSLHLCTKRTLQPSNNPPRYLASLNSFIKTAYIKFMEFFDTASTIEEIEDHFNMDEFSDVTMLNKPMIFISPKEIASTHQLLLDHQKEVICRQYLCHSYVLFLCVC